MVFWLIGWSVDLMDAWWIYGWLPTCVACSRIEPTSETPCMHTYLLAYPHPTTAATTPGRLGPDGQPLDGIDADDSEAEAGAFRCVHRCVYIHF